MAGTRKVVIVGLVLTLWNAMGLLSFVHDFTMTPADIARLPANAAGMYMAMPAWEWVVYGVGTSVGLLGALAMVARRTGAEPLSLFSLIMVLIQFATRFFPRHAAGQTAPGAIAFAGFITIMSLVQFALARRWRKAGLLRA